jgi:hypothetical protein
MGTSERISLEAFAKLNRNLEMSLVMIVKDAAYETVSELLMI